MKVQRQAALCIREALKTTPSTALDVRLNFAFLDIVGKKSAKNSALRLRAYDLWKSNNFGHSNTRCVQKVSRILNFRGLRIFDFRFFCGVMLVLMFLIYADKYGHFECLVNF